MDRHSRINNSEATSITTIVTFNISKDFSDDSPASVNIQISCTSVGGSAATLCGRDAVHLSPARAGSVKLDELAARLEPLGRVRLHEYVLVFTAGKHEITVFEDGRALIKGTSDPAAARSLYDRYVGS